MTCPCPRCVCACHGLLLPIIMPTGAYELSMCSCCDPPGSQQQAVSSCRRGDGPASSPIKSNLGLLVLVFERMRPIKPAQYVLHRVSLRRPTVIVCHECGSCAHAKLAVRTWKDSVLSNFSSGD